MTPTAYVNGEFVPQSEAKVSIFDRGFLFGDGVYEVTMVLEGRLVDNDAHMARLSRSLRELRMKAPLSDSEIIAAQQRLIELNGLREGSVYLQVTRGVAERAFALPDVEPTLIMFSAAKNIVEDPVAERGLAVITTPDIRWKRRDIKTVSLLAAAMARQQAMDQGADDAWMVEDGHVTEGSSNNTFILTKDNVLVSQSLGNAMLSGITRKAVLKLAEQDGMQIEVRSFSPEEALEAAEAFVTSATSTVMPVVKIDGRTVGTGVPGPVARKLRALYLEIARSGGLSQAAAE